MTFRDILDSFMRKKPKVKPLSEIISEAVASDTIRNYMYLNKNIESLLFYRKGYEWFMAKKPENCISKNIEEKLQNIFSNYVNSYESLYNNSHFSLDKVKYSARREIWDWVVDIEFCSGHSSFMTMEHSRIINERIRKSLEEEKAYKKR